MKSLVFASFIFTAAAPALATTFLVDFERSWSYGDTVDNTYASQGVVFTNVLGVSNNDGLGNLPGGDYFANAPTPIGVAFVQLDPLINTAAYINVAGGADKPLTFFYSSPSAVTNAVKAYSGLNGTGTLLGTLSLSATDPNYSVWNQASLTFSGTALSFDISAFDEIVAFDNIASIPEAEEYAMMLSGLGLLALMTKRRNKKSAVKSSTAALSIK